MRTKLVTFLYFGIHGFPFYGYETTARWDRYIYSLLQLAKMNVPIVCYCGQNIHDKLQSFLDDNKVTNVNLKIKELKDVRYVADMIKIKEKHPDKFNYYFEVGWAKIALMEEEMETGLDYLYWIDCGLSHIGLFPDRYNSNFDKVTGLSDNKFRYTYDGVFRQNLFQEINEWVGNKLIDIRNTQFFYNPNQLNETLEKDHAYQSLSVGGIIGGHISRLPYLFNKFEQYARICLDKEFLLDHEAIMSTIGYDEPQHYSVYVFDTWHHEDSYSHMPSITPEFLAGKRSFYTFFEKVRKKPMDDFFDKALNHYGRKGEKLFMINIGAMDGEMFDAMSGYANIYNSDVLYVEPIKTHFERLVKNKSGNPGNRFENAAISDYDGTITMKTIPVDIIDAGLVHHAFYGMSVIDSARNGMGSELDREVVEKYAVDVEVKCLSFQTLIDKYKIEHFDVLYIDAEGHDYTIFKQVDLQKFRPKLIRLEYCNLTDEEKQQIEKKLTDNGYVFEIFNDVDIDALRRDVYDEVRKTLPAPVEKAERHADTEIKSNITIVTGLWNIKRDELAEGWSRSFEHYLEKFDAFLDIPNNLIIFGDEELRDFVFKKRTTKNTLFIARTQEWFKNEFYNKIQEIRNLTAWQAQAGWLSESPQCRLEMYNPLVMSKPFLLHDAKVLDQFDSTHLFWLDAAITNTVHPGYFTHDRVLDKLTDTDCLSFVAFPYAANNEIHGFEYTKLCKIAGDRVDKVCRGGFFGGPKEAIPAFNSRYYQLMKETLDQGYMGTEESLFSIMIYKYPQDYAYYRIEENGLLNKFFEDVKNNVHKKESTRKVHGSHGALSIQNTALYVITFNSPGQVRALIQSMLDYDKDFLEQPQWIMLNNSTDLSTTPDYEKICEQYDIIHIKKDNLGICGGRQFIAEHAAESGYDYYFFFEDDMFFYPDVGAVCKNGFNRYTEGLYQKSLQIVKRKHFDFLKLSFSEFYGDNKTQWAWYNVPQAFRAAHWPDKPLLPEHGLDPDAPKTKFNKIDVYEGVPLADGEIYYCNWPQLVSKPGNQKMFLNEKWAHPYEQTWMSYMFQETIKGNLYPGILLLSPIEHDRFDHYDKELRVESKMV